MKSPRPPAPAAGSTRTASRPPRRGTSAQATTRAGSGRSSDRVSTSAGRGSAARTGKAAPRAGANSAARRAVNGTGPRRVSRVPVVTPQRSGPSAETLAERAQPAMAWMVMAATGDPVRRKRQREAEPAANAQRRIRAVACVFVVLFVGLICRVGFVSAGTYDDVAQEEVAKLQVSEHQYALRGAITDRNGEPFVLSEPAKQISIDPRNVGNDVEKTVAVLSKELAVPPETIRAAAMQPDARSVTVARQVEPLTAQNILNARLPGVGVDDDPKRVVVSGDLARSVIGSMDKWAEKPLAGLEKSLDGQLRASDGRRDMERGTLGRVIPGTETEVAQAQSGKDVWLTIDRSIQLLAERELANQVAATGAKNATAIVGNPRTGEIYAMASVTKTEVGVVSGSLNQAVRIYEPGSVMKAVTVASAFDSGTATPDSIFSVPDHLTRYDRTVRDHDAHPTQDMSVSEIVAQSSNVGTIRIAEQLGKEKMVSYLQAFGFGIPTPLDMYKEQSGEVKGHWNGTDIMSIPIGQSITATPLQIWSAYNTIANRGLYVNPKIVAATVNPDGTRSEAPDSPTRRVISPEAAAMATTTLERVIADGTGKQWQIPGYRVAAKTGTAYKPIGNGTYGTDATGHLYSASFAGFFPASDPKVSIIVMVDEPQPPSHLGSVAAGPVFERLAVESIRKFSIPGDNESTTNEASSATPSTQVRPPFAPTALIPSDGTASGASQIGTASGATPSTKPKTRNGTG